MRYVRQLKLGCFPTQVSNMCCSIEWLNSKMTKRPRIVLDAIRGQCYKNTMVNYRCNFNTTFSRVKITVKNYLRSKNITAILGQIMLYNISYTNTSVIYCHFAVITKVMLLYNTKWQYGHGMAVNYCCKKFYNIGLRYLTSQDDQQKSWWKVKLGVLTCKSTTVSFQDFSLGSYWTVVGSSCWILSSLGAPQQSALWHSAQQLSA